MVTARFPAIGGAGQADLRISYRAGAGVLARILERCTGAGFRVVALRVDQDPWTDRAGDRAAAGSARVQLSREGTGDIPSLVTGLAEMSGVLGVSSLAEEADYQRGSATSFTTGPAGAARSGAEGGVVGHDRAGSGGDLGEAGVPDDGET